MKTIEKQKVVKKKGKSLKVDESNNEIVMRAEFDGKLIALMKVKPPKKED